MNVGLYSTIIQAQVMAEREAIEKAYDTYPDPTLYWCFIDLVQSSNYRLSRGSKSGYLRSEAFFSLARSVIAYVPEVQLIKEIGDSVFLSSDQIRYLLEAMVLIDQVALQMSQVAGTPEHPFAIRGAIGHGPAKRLSRRVDDFVGTAIDQLARLMGERSDKYNLLIHEDAYTPAAQIISEYDAFLTARPPDLLSQQGSKGLIKPVYYRWIAINRPALVEFRDYFTHWRVTHRDDDVR